ncbi:MAG: hypothetical protein K6G34_07490 [Lachnospiraceae bacterium]|nr:hypothetical protein [Lachnospiraceae bacterium]
MEESSFFSTEEVYALYRTQISEMIAYIEVYEHDLPPVLTSLIGEMFSAITVATISDYEESAELTGLIKSVVQYIRLHAIFVFINEIGERERLFNRFKYKGAMIPDTDIHVFDEVEKRKNKAVSLLTDKLKKYYQYSAKIMFSLVADPDSSYGVRDLLTYLVDYLCLYGTKSLSEWDEPFIPADCLSINEGNIDDLSEDYDNFKELLSFCESHMPDVINTGPKVNLRMSVFVAVTSWIIPIVLGIPAMRYLMEGVKTFFHLFGI